MGSLDGKTLGHFRVERLIGRGGMGAVYEAVDEKLERQVALKVMEHESSNTALARKRFLREARLAAKVTHPNIATVFEVGEFESDLYIVMELLEGKSLRKLMTNQRLTPQQSLEIGRDVARALARAHAAGVTHRDIKPENVFITTPSPNVMQAKVLDFGLARQAATKPRVEMNQENTATDATRPGDIVGTPGYWSPEQARAGEVDARTDVFSFGLVLYEMLTGRQAFRANNTVALVLAVTRYEPEPVRKYVPNIATQVEALLAKCLAKDPARRFADGSELLLAVDEVVAVAARISSPDLGDPTMADASGPPVSLLDSEDLVTNPEPKTIAGPPPVPVPAARAVPAPPDSAPAPHAPTPGPVVRDRVPAAIPIAGTVERLRLFVAIGAGFAVAGVVLILATVFWGRPDRPDRPDRASSRAAPMAAASDPAPVASASPPSLAIAAPPVASSSDPAEELDTPPAKTADPAPAVTMTPTPLAAAATAPNANGAPSSRPRVRDRKADCAQPFTVDAKGVKIPKLHCL